MNRNVLLGQTTPNPTTLQRQANTMLMPNNVHQERCLALTSVGATRIRKAPTSTLAPIRTAMLPINVNVKKARECVSVH